MTADEVYVALQWMFDATAKQFQLGEERLDERVRELGNRLDERFSALENRLARRIDGISDKLDEVGGPDRRGAPPCTRTRQRPAPT